MQYVNSCFTARIWRTKCCKPLKIEGKSAKLTWGVEAGLPTLFRMLRNAMDSAIIGENKSVLHRVVSESGN